MGTEIERKFLVNQELWQQHKQADSSVQGTLYRQGYIPTLNQRTVRVRVAGEQGYLTLKGPVLDLARLEFEYPIPLADATQMLNQLCELPLIEKIRYKVYTGSLIWEIDEFLGANQGLLIAEVELQNANQVVELPEWVGEEVSGKPRYYNSSLAKCPFTLW
jgi:CYTH domain-containing protein